MHIFDYSFLKNDLLPAQLVNITSNITALKTMAEFRQRDNHAIFRKLESIAKIESIKASNAIEGIGQTDGALSASSPPAQLTRPN